MTGIGREAAIDLADEQRSAYRGCASKRRLSATSNKSAVSTLLIQCPLMEEPCGAHNICIWAQSGHWKGPEVSLWPAAMSVLEN